VDAEELRRSVVPEVDDELAVACRLGARASDVVEEPPALVGKIAELADRCLAAEDTSPKKRSFRFIAADDPRAFGNGARVVRRLRSRGRRYRRARRVRARN